MLHIIHFCLDTLQLLPLPSSCFVTINPSDLNAVLLSPPSHRFVFAYPFNHSSLSIRLIYYLVHLPIRLCPHLYLSFSVIPIMYPDNGAFFLDERWYEYERYDLQLFAIAKETKEMRQGQGTRGLWSILKVHPSIISNPIKRRGSTLFLRKIYCDYYVSGIIFMK